MRYHQLDSSGALLRRHLAVGIDLVHVSVHLHGLHDGVLRVMIVDVTIVVNKIE